MEMVGGNEEGNEQVDEVEILVECESRSSDKTISRILRPTNL